MNCVRGLFEQQLGFRKLDRYDNALGRLRCTMDEEFRGIFGYVGSHEEPDTPIFACKFAKKKGYQHLLALANEDGKLVVLDTNSQNPRQIRQGRQIHQNAIFDIAWLTDAFKLVTVSGDHTARLIDLTNGDCLMETMFTGHTRSVKSVAVRKTDSSVFATGSRDGSIRLWDTRTVKASNLIVSCDRTIINSHFRTTPTSSKRRVFTNVSSANSVTGLAFQDENTLVSCGSGDGLIKVWDLRKTYNTGKPAPKNTIRYSGGTTRNGFSNVIIDPSGLKLYANCLDNTIYCYNLGTCDERPVMEYKGHQNSSFYIKSTLSADGKYLFSGSTDHNAYIWNINQEEALYKLVGHTAEVTCVAWKEHEEVLVTCSDDVHHKVWRIGGEVLPENWKEIGRGEAETVIVTPRKRQIDINEVTPSQSKRLRVSSNKRSLDDPTFTQSKRSNRRLFDNTYQTPSTSSRHDDDSLAVVIEENEAAFKTPKGSGKGMSTPPETFSPTTNLPNFVVDGSAPHLNYSPQKRMDRDWLTKMRVERSLVREMQELASGGPSSPKQPKLEENSPKSRSRRRTSRSGLPQPHILHYFRVTNNSIMKDSQCSPKNQLQISNHNLQTTREQ